MNVIQLIPDSACSAMSALKMCFSIWNRNMASQSHMSSILSIKTRTYTWRSTEWLWWSSVLIVAASSRRCGSSANMHISASICIFPTTQMVFRNFSTSETVIRPIYETRKVRGASLTSWLHAKWLIHLFSKVKFELAKRWKSHRSWKQHSANENALNIINAHYASKTQCSKENLLKKWKMRTKHKKKITKHCALGVA